MSKQKIELKDLQVGMYIELPTSWLSHDFLTSNFKITSKEVLNKVKKLKLADITIDLDKSNLIVEIPKDKPKSPPALITDPKTTTDFPPKERVKKKKVWDSEFIETEKVWEALDNRKSEPAQKAKNVYKASLDMMEQLMEFPTTENIKNSKQAIYEISDMALSDNETSEHLLHITSHDYETYSHSVNVGIYGIMLSKVLYKNSDAHNIRELAAGYFLHDLGKTAIELEVLNKPGKLTDIERQHIKTHPYMGYKLLQEANELTRESKIIVLQHHEHYNGSGYPNRMQGDEIHEYARICAVADVFDALTTERSYKKAIDPFDALRLMKNEMLLNFDERIFTHFVQLFMNR